MDRHWMEMWGRFLLAAAQGLERMETVSDWVRKGWEGTGEMSEAFYRAWGLEGASSDERERALADFQKAQREMARFWGWVPAGEYKGLEERCARLEQTLAERDETIERLRRLLSESGSSQGDLLQRFQDMMAEQGEQFQELMSLMGKAMET
jgi:hypothetical protein